MSSKVPHVKPIYLILLGFAGLITFCVGLVMNQIALMILGFLLLVAMILPGAMRLEAEKVVKAKQKEEQARAALAAIQAAPVLPITPSGLLLQRSETCYLQEPCQLQIPVTESHRVGGSRGISVPIGHGVRVRTGGFRSSTVTEERIERDNGVVYVTNHRIVFLGKENVIVRFADILAVQGAPDGLDLRTNHIPRLFLRTRSFRLAVVVDKMLNGTAASDGSPS